MSRLYAKWTQGWLVGFRYFWLGCVLSFFGLPLALLKICLPGVEEDQVFSADGFHWRAALFVMGLVIWLPLAPFHTGRFTHAFEEDETAEPDGAVNSHRAGQ